MNNNYKKRHAVYRKLYNMDNRALRYRHTGYFLASLSFMRGQNFCVPDVVSNFHVYWFNIFWYLGLSSLSIFTGNCRLWAIFWRSWGQYGSNVTIRYSNCKQVYPWLKAHLNSVLVASQYSSGTVGQGKESKTTKKLIVINWLFIQTRIWIDSTSTCAFLSWHKLPIRQNTSAIKYPEYIFSMNQ